MIVYGKRKTKYVLSKKPVRGDGESAVYQVSGRNDILVKIYQKQMRTLEKEYQVTEAINGTGAMLGEFPIDMVYERGKFVGYVFENEESYQPVEEESIAVPQSKGGMSEATVVMLSVVLGMGLSAAMYFGAFPVISRSILPENLPYYFKGIPMIIGGWLGLMFILIKFERDEFKTIILSTLVFICGNIAVFCLTWLLIAVIKTAVAVIGAVMPIVIAAAAIIYIIKKVLR